MTVDFHYDPLTGAISGPDFIDQTERAVNELGGTAYEAAGKADAAIALGHQALADAMNSAMAAAAAQVRADDAWELANQADEKADVADAKAVAAKVRADEAYDLAATAGTAAGGAGSAAAAAQATADQALSTANSGKATADQALWTGEMAHDAALRADDIYRLAGEAVDADERYSMPEKILIGEAGGTGLPDGLAVPIWLNVAVDDGTTQATQNCWDHTAARVFTRTAEVNLSDSANPIVAWGPWNSVAVPEVVRDVALVEDPAGQPAGTYLAITFETASGDEVVFVSLSALVKVYEAGNDGITVSADDKIGLRLATSAGGLVIDGGLKYTEPSATEAVKGLVRLATSAEASSGATSGAVPTVARAKQMITAAAPGPATSAVSGLVRLPTAAEVTSGGSAVTTVDNVKAMIAGSAVTVPPFATSMGNLAYGGSASAGVADTIARGDHRHGSDPLPTASTTSAGLARLATPDETLAGTATGAVTTVHDVTDMIAQSTPGDATSQAKGLVRLATASEVAAGTATGAVTTVKDVADMLPAPPAPPAAATESASGLVRLATAAEAGTGTTNAAVPTVLRTKSMITGAAPGAATTTTAGLTRLATASEVVAGTTTGAVPTVKDVKDMMPSVPSAPGSASETASGLVRLATAAEAAAGTTGEAVPTVARTKSMIPAFAASVSTLVYGGTGSAGSSGTISDGGHVHTQPALPTATSAVSGIVRTATTAEASAGTNGSAVLTVANGATLISAKVLDATSAVAGKVRTATSAEITAGTTTAAVPTVAQVKSMIPATLTTTVTRGAITTAVANNASVTVGSYIVGSNRLLVYYDGLICRPGTSYQYTETGTAGASSTTIKMLFAIPAGHLLEYVIIN